MKSPWYGPPLDSARGTMAGPGYPQTHVAQTYARFVTSDGLTGETAGPAFTTESPYEPPGFVPAAREGIMPPLTVTADGTLDVPQSPGLGLQVDEKLLRRHGRRFHVSTPARVALHTMREKGIKAALTLEKAKQGQG